MQSDGSPASADEAGDSPANLAHTTATPDGADLDHHDHPDRHDRHDHPPPGATVYPPGAVGTSSALNPRSCVTCRRRKVRCDKHMPCSNCRRAKIPCIFPAPGRAPRRPRPKDPNAPPKAPSSEREMELMKRLRKLEGIVEDLSGQIEVEAVRHPSSASAETTPEGDASVSSPGVGPAGAASCRPLGGLGGKRPPRDSNSPASSSAPADRWNSAAAKQSPGAGTPVAEVGKMFGRLVLHENGKSRYVSSGFWSKVNDELDELRAEALRLTDEDSDLSEDESSPASSAQNPPDADHHAFLLGYSSANVNLRPLHPLVSQIPYMWEKYKDNVDSIIKVLHIPSMNKLIRDLVRSNLENLTPPTEALLFTIYYAAVTSMEPDEVKTHFGAEQSLLLSRFRFGIEQALAQANLLTTSDFVVCQALVLFLVLVRRHDSSRFGWTLTALVARLSQSLGLHRDGTQFPNLSPFEVEMRRRLFWAILTLDLRSAEDQGTDLVVFDRTSDTRFPLNINDTDIDPKDTVFPTARDGHTDMTFSLVRFEICSVARKLHTISSAGALACPRATYPSLEERDQMVRDAQHRVERLYLRDPASETNPLYWVASNVVRLIIAKITMVIYQHTLLPGNDGYDEVSAEQRDRLFAAAIDIFELAYQLSNDERCRPWRWLFKTYTHWHAVAFVLIEASHRPWGPNIERAYGAMNACLAGSSPAEAERMAENTAVWLPLRRLLVKVRRHRDAEVARLLADPRAACELELQDIAREAPASFNGIAGSLKSRAARDRWRKLVGAPPIPPDAQAQAQAQGRARALASLAASGFSSAPWERTSDQQTGVDAAASSGLQSGPDKNMQILDSVMSQPTFDVTQMFPMVFGADFAAPDPTLHTNTMFNYMGGSRAGDAAGAGGGAPASALANSGGVGNQSGPQTESISTVMPASLSTTTTPQQQQQQQQHGLTPTSTVRIPEMDSNPPPWAWSPNASTANIMAFPGVPAEDMDVNMDEPFDWPSWQESLKGFQYESGAAGTLGGVGWDHIV